MGVYYKSGDYANYELSDHLSNVRVVLNEAGEREAYSDYYPYGLVMSPSEVAPDNYRYGYQGQFAEKDEETGWNTFELRMYDPVIGRWLGPDPYRQFYSAYVGMGNNPVSGVDPDGGKVNPIFDMDGNYLGNDDLGFNGEAIVMDKSLYYSGIKHEEALERGVYYSKAEGMSWNAMINLVSTWQELPKEINGELYFQGVRIFQSEIGDLKHGAAFAFPGIGIFLNPKDVGKLDLLRHEFGHILQARRYGWGYFPVYAAVSLHSTQIKDKSHRHQRTWSETEANTLSYLHFGKPQNWNFAKYPVDQNYLKKVSPSW